MRGFRNVPKITELANGEDGGQAQAAWGPGSTLHHIQCCTPNSRLGPWKSQCPSFHSPTLETEAGYFLESICPQGRRGPLNSRVWSPCVPVRSMTVHFQGQSRWLGRQSWSPELEGSCLPQFTCFTCTVYLLCFLEGHRCRGQVWLGLRPRPSPIFLCSTGWLGSPPSQPRPPWRCGCQGLQLHLF